LNEYKFGKTTQKEEMRGSTAAQQRRAEVKRTGVYAHEPLPNT